MDRGEWVATTHDWSAVVDGAHLALIRADPGRYCPGGEVHLLLEVLAYAHDEALTLGRPGHCEVHVRGDGSVVVSDDGRGTDTRRDVDGRFVRKPIMSTKDLRLFDSVDPVLLPDGFPRRGISVVAALSDWLVHINRRPDGAWEQRYEHGIPVGTLREIEQGEGRGTTVCYHSDASVRAESARFAEARWYADGFPGLTVTVHT